MPDLEPEEVGKLVEKYLQVRSLPPCSAFQRSSFTPSSTLQDEFAKLGSKNTLKVEMLHGGKPWVTSSASRLSRSPLAPTSR